MKIFNKIYVGLIVIILGILIIVPQEQNLNDKEFETIKVTVSDDGSMRVRNDMSFEKKVTLPVDITEEIDSSLNARNIKVYGKNIFGDHKLNHHTEYLPNKNTKILFTKDFKYSSYYITYDTENIIRKYDDGLGILYPVTINNELWTNNLKVVFEFYKDLNLSDKDKVITKVYPLAISDKRVDITGNTVTIESTNYPSHNNSSVVLKFDEEQLREESLKNIEKSSDDINLTEKALAEKQEVQKQLLNENKEKRNYDLTIVRKYISYSVITVISMLFIVYIYLIFRGIRMRRFKLSNVKESSSQPFDKDLIKTFVYMDHDIEDELSKVSHLLSAIFKKLEVLGYIIIEDKGIKISEKSQSEIRALSQTEREILNIVYSSDVDNTNIAKYDELYNKLNESSANIIALINEEKESKSNQLAKSGKYVYEMQRVDFKTILFQIPILLLLVIYGYTNIILASIIFIMLYIIMFIATRVNDGGYTKKGIKEKRLVKGYESHLKDKINKNKEMTEEEEIYSLLFGLNENEDENICKLGKEAASYIKLIRLIRKDKEKEVKEANAKYNLNDIRNEIDKEEKDDSLF